MRNESLQYIRERIAETISAASPTIRRAAERGDHAERRRLEDELNCSLGAMRLEEERLVKAMADVEALKPAPVLVFEGDEAELKSRPWCWNRFALDEPSGEDRERLEAVDAEFRERKKNLVGVQVFRGRRHV